jgi:starvation-inducible DNA-binding protein
MNMQHRPPDSRIFADRSDRDGAEPIEVAMTALNALLTDLSSLYARAKAVHWHLSGPYFRDHRLPPDERTLRILAAMDAIASRTRKLGGTVLGCLAHIDRLRHLVGDEADLVLPHRMLGELHEDMMALAAYMHDVDALNGAQAGRTATSRLEIWLDDAEQRGRRLVEAARRGE